jgi:hypothetical protein
MDNETIKRAPRQSSSLEASKGRARYFATAMLPWFGHATAMIATAWDFNSFDRTGKALDNN